MKLESENWKRDLYIGDNLAVMRGLNSETVDLIYLDPPFNSKRMYEGNLDPEMGKQSFSDIWGDSDITESDRIILENQYPQCAALIDVLGQSHGKAAKSYLSFMGIRLMEMHRLLKEMGGIYLHCDHHMSHPLKMVMDIIFGAKNFRNEIIWAYTGPSSPGIKQFPRKHDCVFWYTKTSKWIFNREDMRVPYKDPKQTLRRAMDAGRGIGQSEVEKYRARGKVIENWWADIALAVRSPNERTGWATQKPLVLLERIIKASSDKGDVVLDPFCGCGTACVAATHLGRQWIGIDQHPSAEAIMKQRIMKDTKLAPEWDGVNVVNAQAAANLPKRSDVQKFKKTDAGKRTLYERQKGKCASGEYCLNGAERKPINFMHIDRIMPGKRGGEYVDGNVQLLCSTCNGAKGKKTWKAFIDGLKREKVKQLIEELDSPDME